MAFHQGDLGWSCRPKSNGIIGLASLKRVSLSTGKYTQKESGCQLNFFWQVDPFCKFVNDVLQIREGL